MHKLFALCLVLLFVLGACVNNDTKFAPNASSPAGSEIARPNPTQAGTIGH